MPAHTRADEVGVTLKGDGSTLTVVDRAGNARANAEAKLAWAEGTETGARGREERHRGRFCIGLLGWHVWLVSRSPHPPTTQRSEAMHTLARTVVQRELATRTVCSAYKASRVRPPQLGGHSLQLRGSVWQCSECRMSSSTREVIECMRCTASSTARWAARATLDAKHGSADGGGHQRFLSGDVLWCRRCGCYADF